MNGGECVWVARQNPRTCGLPAAPRQLNKRRNSRSEPCGHAAAAARHRAAQLLHSSQTLHWRSCCIQPPAWTAALVAEQVHDRTQVERFVLRYLLQHPAAADSIEGVRTWWLREAGPVSETILRDVLDGLCVRGWLMTRGDLPETRIYSFNEPEREAVERFIGAPEKRHG